MRTVSFDVEGMHCPSCGLLIDDCLMDVDGVQFARTDLKGNRTVVTAEDSVSDQALLDAIAEAGYSGRPS